MRETGPRVDRIELSEIATSSVKAVGELFHSLAPDEFGPWKARGQKMETAANPQQRNHINFAAKGFQQIRRPTESADPHIQKC